jgi:hypothetical protein
MKKKETISMTDYLVMTKRKVKTQFIEQLNTLVDWRPISNIINKHYVKRDDVWWLTSIFRSYFIQNGIITNMV